MACELRFRELNSVAQGSSTQVGLPFLLPHVEPELKWKPNTSSDAGFNAMPRQCRVADNRTHPGPLCSAFISRDEITRRMRANFQSVQVAKVTCSHCGSQRRFAVPTLTREILQQLYGLRCSRCGTPDNALELAIEPYSSDLAVEEVPGLSTVGE
jgi:DNA-directed RNA polymerase subunit RPC12/RpoP